MEFGFEKCAKSTLERGKPQQKHQICNDTLAHV